MAHNNLFTDLRSRLTVKLKKKSPLGDWSIVISLDLVDQLYDTLALEDYHNV
jgi:hypothetical protein